MTEARSDTDDEPDDNPYVRDPELDFDEVSEMTEREAEKQVENLREAVEYHDYRYYVENDPVISDKAYDRLFERLEELEDEFSLVDEDSPTRRVGGEPLDSLESREHVEEMLSLNSSEDAADVREFDRRVREEVDEVVYSAEPKFDGISIEVVYLDGEFDRAVTRGDGTTGEDVSENVRTVRSVPLKLRGQPPDEISVRGEIYMPRSGFQEINEERVEEGKDPFANPRNAAAGTVRQLDPEVVADRPLDIYFYDILETTAEVGAQEDAFELMDSIGLRLNEHNATVEEIEVFIQYREELLEKRDELEYDIDGVVAKVNRYDHREEIGETERHPNWAFAYKFPAKKEVTVVENIVVQVGRTGKLTPVALLDPVDIDGVTVSRATLHNEKQAKRLGVSEGSEVRVERAGDVIPEVVEVVGSEDEEGFEMPESCPVCGSDVVSDGEHHYCTGGVSCDAQLKRSVEHFCSKGGMDIEGVGEKVADQLVEEGLVETVGDLYELSEEDLTELERFGGKSARNLLNEIEASKTVDLTSFVYALGIPHIGKKRARLIARNFSLDSLMEADYDSLRQVSDIGDEAAKSIRSFFENDSNIAVVEKILSEGVKPKRMRTTDELQGLTFVFTGSLDNYTREEITDKVERHGGDVTSSVSGETDYLVVGKNPGNTKIEDADRHGVKVIDRGEFKNEFLDDIVE